MHRRASTNPLLFFCLGAKEGGPFPFLISFDKSRSLGGGVRVPPPFVLVGSRVRTGDFPPPISFLK